MSNKNTGGAAFPRNYERNGHNGMDLRDYFAAKAMQGMLAHSTRYKQRPEDKDLHWHKALVKEAFEVADAMLKEREK